MDSEKLDVERLLASYQTALRRFVHLNAATIVRRRESLSDLVQTVFRELFEAIGQVRFEHETQFRNWLFVTARNKLRDRLKYHLRARRHPRRQAPLEPSDEMRDVWTDAYCEFVTPSRAAVTKEEMARIERAFAQLSDDHREVIVLSRIREMPASEIGQIIGRGEAATRALLSRALARLAVLLRCER